MEFMTLKMLGVQLTMQKHHLGGVYDPGVAGVGRTIVIGGVATLELLRWHQSGVGAFRE